MAQAVSGASAVLLWETCTCVHDSLSPKGAKSQQGNAHVALLSSLGYNNESNCVSLFARAHTHTNTQNIRVLVHFSVARSARKQVVFCTQS